MAKDILTRILWKEELDYKLICQTIDRLLLLGQQLMANFLLTGTQRAQAWNSSLLFKHSPNVWSAENISRMRR